MENMSLATFITKWDNGEFNKSTSSMCKAGWYDWFCKDQSLHSRLAKMINCVKAAANSPLINPESTYVFFKNNCPMSGPLYDSFSICDLLSGDVLYWVTLKSGHTGEAEVMAAPDFENNTLPVNQRNANGIKKFFKRG